MATPHDPGFRGFVGESLGYVAAVEADWVALGGGRPLPGWCGRAISGSGEVAPSKGRGGNSR